MENTCGCVLGPWPWPQAFLSLASRGSVLAKAVLGLGLGFFLCPWPRALCPRLHLCYSALTLASAMLWYRIDNDFQTNCVCSALAPFSLTCAQLDNRPRVLLQYRKLCYANGLNRERRAGTSTLFKQTIIISKAQTVQIKVLSNRFKSQNKSWSSKLIPRNWNQIFLTIPDNLRFEPWRFGILYCPSLFVL